MDTRRGTLLLCHGLGSNDTAFVGDNDTPEALEANAELAALRARSDIQIIIHGHTHRRMVRHFDNHTFINAGTLYSRQEPGVVLANLVSGDIRWLHLGDGRPVRLDRLGRFRGESGDAQEEVVVVEVSDLGEEARERCFEKAVASSDDSVWARAEKMRSAEAPASPRKPWWKLW